MINFKQFLKEALSNIYYHGTPDKNIQGKKGIHIGTKLAATQALNARIGVPAQGEWGGTKEYGKTLLAGKKTLRKLEQSGDFCETGYNCGSDVPEEDYYPTQRKTRAKYSDGIPIPFDAKPIIMAVRIVGKMSNTPNNPTTDSRANSMILKYLKMNNAKSGYFYINDAEDEGSVSAVVPDFSFLQIVNNPIIENFKQSQLNLILKHNPMTDDIHTGIRAINDIKTAEEAFSDDNWEATPDFTKEDMLKALKNNSITMYSSKPFTNGSFISPSKMEAINYSGIGKIYSKTIPLNHIAWIDSTQGQYTPIILKK